MSLPSPAATLSEESFWQEITKDMPQGNNTDYRRFIILGTRRTGSTYLLDLLQSHPNIYAKHELFKELEVKGFGRHPLGKRLMDIREKDPLGFLNKILFRPMPDNIETVGFKIFYHHLEQAYWLWGVLRSMPEMRVIHVKRRNLLQAFYSYKRAMQDQHWINNGNYTPSILPLTLDPEACVQFFHSIEEQSALFDSFFRDKQLIVQYDDLVADKDEVMQRVQEFLRVPVIHLDSKLLKQNPFPLRECIENYAAIRERLLGTQWEKFLDDSVCSDDSKQVLAPLAPSIISPPDAKNISSRSDAHLAEDKFWNQILQNEPTGQNLDYQRFIILGWPRTGSNLLLTLLQSHPNVRAMGELFHDKTLVFDYKDHPLHLELLRRRNEDPLTFLRRFVYPPLSPTIKACGFKLFYTQIQNGLETIPFHLRRQPNFRVIHLKRRNVLRSYYSLERAWANKKWWTKDACVAASPITLDPDSCIRHLSQFDASCERFDAFFRDIQLEIWYEDLSSDMSSTMRQVQDFLGVPALPLTSPLQKQNTLPLSQGIANFKEISAKLRDTKWEWCLAE